MTNDSQLECSQLTILVARDRQNRPAAVRSEQLNDGAQRHAHLDDRRQSDAQTSRVYFCEEHDEVAFLGQLDREQRRRQQLLIAVDPVNRGKSESEQFGSGVR